MDALAQNLLAPVQEQGVSHVDPGIEVLRDHEAQVAVVLGDVVQQLHLHLRAAAHDVGDAHEMQELAAVGLHGEELLVTKELVGELA